MEAEFPHLSPEIRVPSPATVNPAFLCRLRLSHRRDMPQVALLSMKPNPSSSDSEEWKFEEVEYIVADNESSWVHVKGLGPSYGQPHDQIIVTSGYPGLQVMARSFSHEDTSSHGSPGILTPGTSTVSQALSSPNSLSNQLAQRPEPTFETRHSSHGGAVHDDDAATGTSQTHSQGTRPARPLPFAITRIQMPTHSQVRDSLLRYVSV